MKKILVIGSLNMDLVINTGKIPVMGETVLGSGFLTAPGGKGANQAVAAAKLGGDVTMVGCIGNDVFGEQLIENLKKSHAKTEYIGVVDEISSGIAVITVKDGNNSIIVAPGANNCLTPQRIVELENLIKNCSFMILQMEIPIETVNTAIDLARKHGVTVVLNPAPAITLDEEFLSRVDLLVLNESESEIITRRNVKSVDDAKSVIMTLNEIGVKQVVVTMGGKGAVYNDGKNIVHALVPNVKVVDTTAAGDSFIGALTVALSQGKSMEQAVGYANIVGTLTVTKKGAQISLPDTKDVENFISSLKATKQ